MGPAWQEGGEATEEFSEKVMHFRAEEWGKDSQGESERTLIVYIFITAEGGRSQETLFVVWESPVTALEYVSGLIFFTGEIKIEEKPRDSSGDLWSLWITA